MLEYFWSQFRGGAVSLLNWYTVALRPSLNALVFPIIMVTAIAIASFFIGYKQIDRFSVSLENLSFGDVNTNMVNMLDLLGETPLLPILSIWWQNFRAILIALLLGIFSLGILGSIPVIATVGIAGYLLAVLQGSGLPPETFALFILPHGVIEIPAVILATAAVERLGACPAQPVSEKTVSEVFISGLAEWDRIIAGVVIPFLFIATAVEIWITPRIIKWLAFRKSGFIALFEASVNKSFE